MDDLTDATGDDGIKAAIAGLSQDLREHLYIEGRSLRRRFDTKRRAHASGQLVDAPPPTKTTDSDLSDLFATLKDAAPDPAKPILALLAAVFPPHGTHISAYLQQYGDPPYRLGASVEVADLSDPANVEPDSIWAQIPTVGDTAEPTSSSVEPRASAFALATVALEYERAGRWADAITNLEAAIEKDPTYADGVTGLRRVLALPTIRHRSEDFVPPLARWLAILIFKRKFTGSSGVGPSRNEESARGLNFVGVEIGMLAGEAQVLDPAALYAKAGSEFRQAIKALPEWYLPYENLADVVSYLGMETGNSDLQREADSWYGEALTRAAERTGYLVDQTTSGLTPPFGDDVVRELHLSRAIARLLSGEFEAAGVDYLDGLGNDFDIAAEGSATVAYTLACFYATVLRLPGKVAWLGDQNVSVLAAASLRRAESLDSTLIATATTDPDLAAFVRTFGHLLPRG